MGLSEEEKIYSRYIFTKYGYILHTKCIFEYNLFQNWPLFGPKHACFILLRTWVQVHVTVHKLCTMYMYITVGSAITITHYNYNCTCEYLREIETMFEKRWCHESCKSHFFSSEPLIDMLKPIQIWLRIRGGIHRRRKKLDLDNQLFRTLVLF